MHTLWPPQKITVDTIEEKIASGMKRGIVQSPTGSGKTFMAGWIGNNVITQQKRQVLFIVDTTTLVEQAMDEFRAFGHSVGALQADHPLTDLGAAYVVATVQTMRARDDEYFLPWLNRFGLIFIDEAHVLHKYHQYILEHALAPVIGLSATPWRTGLGLHFDELIQGTSMKELIDEGYLCDYRVRSTGHPDRSAFRVRSHDFVAKDVAHAYDKELIGHAVRDWQKFAPDAPPTLVFAPTVEKSKELAEMFGEITTAEHIDGYAKDPIKDLKILRDFRAGKITVLCSVAKLTKGFDVKQVACIVDCQPTMSYMRHVQKIGRGLRTADGKKDCLVIDCAGNMEALGYPEYIEFDGLSTHEPVTMAEMGERMPKFCKECGAEIDSLECGNCGHIIIPVADSIEFLPIELQELDKQAYALRAEQELFLEGLVHYKHRLDKPWAKMTHAYEKKFKEKPDFTGVEPVQHEQVDRWLNYIDIQKSKGGRPWWKK